MLPKAVSHQIGLFFHGIFYIFFVVVLVKFFLFLFFWSKTKGAGQHVEGHSTFTNQTVCQPIGTDVFGEDILLLVDKTGLAVTFDIWPAPFENVSSTG